MFLQVRRTLKERERKKKEEVKLKEKRIERRIRIEEEKERKRLAKQRKISPQVRKCPLQVQCETLHFDFQRFTISIPKNMCNEDVSIQDTLLRPKSVNISEVPLYIYILYIYTGTMLVSSPLQFCL